jgi:alcohol dehydrogenase
VDTITTPLLLKIVESGKLQPHKLVTHRFAMNDIVKAYDLFGNAAQEGALKVVLKNDGAKVSDTGSAVAG